MVGKTQSSVIDITIEKLKEGDSTELSSFSCGVEKLDDFFHNEIFICSKYHYLSSYCAREKINNKIAAVFTLANDTVILKTEEDMTDFMSETKEVINDEYHHIFIQQTSFPAINIGHLGVRKDLQSKGIGSQILNFIVSTFTKYELSGCQFITVDSLNNSRTNKFYQSRGFRLQTIHDMCKSTRRMYFPIIEYTAK